MHRHELFILRPFAFYDSCLVAAMGPMLDHVYNVLRTFVWRSVRGCDKVVREFYQRGLLVARISQKKLGEHLGLSVGRVNRYIAQLKKLGWLRVEEATKGGTRVYVLGHVQRSDGCESEGWFADTWQRCLWARMESVAKAKYGDEGKPSHLPIADRVTMVETFVTQTIARNDAETTAQSIPCATSSIGVVLPTTQPLCHQQHTIINKEIENDTELENLFENATRSPGAEQLQDCSNSRGDVVRGSQAKSDYTRVPPPDVSDTPANVYNANTRTVNNSAASAQSAAARMESINEEYRIVVEERGERRAAKEAKRKARQQKKKKYEKRDTPVTRLRTCWEDLVRAEYPGIKFGRWAGKENGQVTRLVEDYGEDIIADALGYMVTTWNEIQKRFTRSQGTIPSIGFLAAVHSTIVPEAQRWSSYRAVKAKVEAWYAANPSEFNLPPALELELEEATKAARGA